MSDRTRVIHPLYNLLPLDVEGFDSLAELALDLRWSWNHGADAIWRQLDPLLWNLTGNPWAVLQSVSRGQLQRVLADPGFRASIDRLVFDRRQAEEAPRWFQQSHPGSSLTCAAYFCMEFMLSEALPIYSGGLGNVAGDQLKVASDLGIPIVGVGLLYQQGYFRQMIDKEGAQEALFPFNDPGQLPVTPLRQENGEWLRVDLDLPGYPICLRAWQVQVGRVALYLLDSNDPANLPVYRGVTSQLYGGGPEMRLMQELALGIGGWRLLRALGIEAEVCHLNEGHAAFAVLERARSVMEETGQSFEIALAASRAGNLFTTHTAVAAAFDRFSAALIKQYLGDYAEEKLGISLHDLLGLGRQRPDDPSESFNMAYLALRGSGAANGVSRLHGAVSRELFTSLFPRWPRDEVPVRHVTNGVHMPTWDSALADRLWEEACGKDRWLGTAESLEERFRKTSDADLWRFRTSSASALVEYARDRLSRELARAGSPPEAVDEAKKLFDPNALTLGFARRFATYKRPNLLLQDPERLIRLLDNPERPVQLVLAGKAHPADQAGQALIQQWIRFIRGTQGRSKVIFLSDYDMLLAGQLVSGVDVWINTPRRPWEACGTSGMKVLVNGGINISELDGWWSEAYSPELGWALGDGREHGDDPARDAAEAAALYDLLERDVVPQFYTRNPEGIPTAWVARMRESMACLTPRFSANRSVREYTKSYYLPAARHYRERRADNAAAGKRIIDWRKRVDEKWPTLRFGEVRIQSGAEGHRFEVQVDLGGLDPMSVRVELYADGADGGPPVRWPMEPAHAKGACLYCVQVPADRPVRDYTPRIVPYYEGLAVPLEESHILWQR